MYARGKTLWNKCKDRHEQKLENLMSEVNEMDADDNQAGNVRWQWHEREERKPAYSLTRDVSDESLS